jgi:hypothetical protein
VNPIYVIFKQISNLLVSWLGNIGHKYGVYTKANCNYHCGVLVGRPDALVDAGEANGNVCQQPEISVLVCNEERGVIITMDSSKIAR